MSKPERIKFTVGPPDLCQGCYWRFRYLDAVEQLKVIRRELVAKRVGAISPPRDKSSDAEPIATTTHDQDVVDLVDQFRRNGGE
jgi:hypothetical protein